MLIIQSLSIEDHLYSSKILPQFVTDEATKTISESAKYKTWKLQDLTLTTWLVESMTTSIKNKVIHLSQFYEVWERIEKYFEDTSASRIQSLKS